MNKKVFKEITNLEVIEYLKNLGRDPNKFCLGNVCNVGHNFNNLGLCIRFKSCQHCLECRR